MYTIHTRLWTWWSCLFVFLIDFVLRVHVVYSRGANIIRAFPNNINDIEDLLALKLHQVYRHHDCVEIMCDLEKAVPNEMIGDAELILSTLMQSPFLLQITL